MAEAAAAPTAPLLAAPGAQAPAPPLARPGSKYDYVKVGPEDVASAPTKRVTTPMRPSPTLPPSLKVRVWLPGEHYYVLSRYLLARTLTAATLPPKRARRAATALKKALVDAGRLDTTQDEMEAALFRALESEGAGAEVRGRYRCVARFSAARAGLAVAACGPPWSGAAALAAGLAARLNLAAPTHVDLLAAALRAPGGPLAPAPPWARGLAGADLDAALDREARVLRAALQSELDKACGEGEGVEG